MRDIIFLDTTLRDGDQAAGYALPLASKVYLAQKLAECKIDVIEAGFPMSSHNEYIACREIAAVLAGTGSTLALMCRGVEKEIRDTAEILSKNNSLLHISLPVSHEHIQSKFRISPAKFLLHAEKLTRYAANYASQIECGAEDATRSDFNFLRDYCETVISAGATVVNIADTLGICVPEQMALLVQKLMQQVKGFADGKARLSVHCHNDNGLAVANTLTAVRCGASQVEVTLCGFGERAGNAAGEEVLANLLAHPDIYDGKCNIPMESLLKCALQFCRLSANPPSPAHPFLGNRIHAHASGIHQNGIMKSPDTYYPDLKFGSLVPERIVLSRHSGKAGILLLAEKCNFPINLTTAEHILAELKRLSGTSLGFTEFLLLYNKYVGISTHCQPMVVKNVFVQGENHRYSINIQRSDGEFFSGKGADMFSAILEAALKMSGKNIVCHRIELFMTDCLYRCYMEIIVNNDPPFAVERDGTEPAFLMVQCFFDALNFHLIKGCHK